MSKSAADMLPILSLVETKLGFDISGFMRPFGLKVVNNDIIYVTDMDLNLIFRVMPERMNYQVLGHDMYKWSELLPLRTNDKATNGSSYRYDLFKGPHSVDFNNQEELVVTCYYSPSIYLIDKNESLVKLISDIDSDISGPATGIADIKKNELLVTEYIKNRIMVFDATTLDFIKDIGPLALDRPHMTISANNRYYYCADTWNNRVLEIDVEGSLLTSKTIVEAGCPVSICNDDKQGILVISQWSDSSICLVDYDGCIIKTFSMSGNQSFNRPYDARLYKDKILVADSHNGRVTATTI